MKKLLLTITLLSPALHMHAMYMDNKKTTQRQPTVYDDEQELTVQELQDRICAENRERATQNGIEAEKREQEAKQQSEIAFACCGAFLVGLKILVATHSTSQK
jgi:hypothetical protein